MTEDLYLHARQHPALPYRDIVSSDDDQRARRSDELARTYPSSEVCTRRLNAESTSSRRMKLLSGTNPRR